MRTDFSKTSADVALEADAWQSHDKALLRHQRVVAKYLLDTPPRDSCLLCEKNLQGVTTYRHRETDYVFCGCCGHLQTKSQLPTGYPHIFAGKGFEAIYPLLDEEAYASRRDRIYAPKLEWALSCMEEVGIKQDISLKSNWMEIGCGAGYFLNALLARGVQNVYGVDENPSLVEVANERCGGRYARVTQNLFAEVEASEANVIVALFVLEHLEEANTFWRILAKKPSGTIFLFAVPSYGISTMLEGAIDSFAARNLDSVIHTQLYSDESINYALNIAGYDKVAEWLFGQDAQDLCRLLVGSIFRHMSGTIRKELINSLSRLVDPLQSIFDRTRLCDARHIIAVRR